MSKSEMKHSMDSSDNTTTKKKPIQSRRDSRGDPSAETYPTTAHTSPVGQDGGSAAGEIQVKTYCVKGDTWKGPVLGSVLLSLTRRPSRWELERDARGQGKETSGGTKQTGTRRGRAGEPATRNQECPATGRPGQGEDKTPGQKHVSSLRSAGSWVGALCPVLGSVPEGSAAEPPRAALLNPPPFECPLGNSSTTVVQRRASREHLPGDSTTTVVSRGLGE